MLKKHKHTRTMSEDEIIDSFLDKDAAKVSRRYKIQTLQDSLDSLKPNYSESDLCPTEIRGVRFNRKAIDYSRTVTAKTEDEIIDSVLNPEKRLKSTSRGAVRFLNTNISPEVQDYMKKKIQETAIRSAKNYKEKVIG